MEGAFRSGIRNIKTNRLIWFIASIIMIFLLISPFQTSRNHGDDGNCKCNRKNIPFFNEIFRPPYYFCQARKFKKFIPAYSSAFSSSFFASAAPVNSKRTDGSKKKNIDKVECAIDKSKGFKNAANIYQCASHQTCCFEYAKPSCCGSKPTLQIM